MKVKNKRRATRKGRGNESQGGETPPLQVARIGRGRNKGGQPGNSNARTHGLWAKYQPLVSPEERDPNAGPEERRDILDRVIKVLFMDFCEAEDPETRCRISNALCVAVTAANGCDRTLAIVVGKLSPLQQAIDELLAEEDPDDYSTVEQTTFKGDRDEDEGEEETEPEKMQGMRKRWRCRQAPTTHTCTATHALGKAPGPSALPAVAVQVRRWSGRRQPVAASPKDLPRMKGGASDGTHADETE